MPRSDPTASGPQKKSDPFDALFLREYGRVVAVAGRVLADRAEAEDVAQEVFINFHRRHPADAPYAAGWLHSAAVHTALNRIRGRRRRTQREVTHERDRSNSLDPQDLVEVAEQRRLVRVALQRLSRKQASVLALRYSGLTYAEVGQALGVATGQVGTMLRRAEAALKKEFERSGTSV
jgi:RNA polymerase sigma-70 factor (ECF subfamily)